MHRFRKSPVFRSYKVVRIEGLICPWRVRFLVDGEDVGGGQYRTSEEADAAGVDYMFSGWGDETGDASA